MAAFNDATKLRDTASPKASKFEKILVLNSQFSILNFPLHSSFERSRAVLAVLLPYLTFK